MDKFSDRNDNNDKHVNNWQQKNNNNVENCVNNEKVVGENSWQKKHLVITNGESKLEPNEQDNQPVDECCKENLVVSSCECDRFDDDIPVDGTSNKSDSTENLSFLNENDLIDDLIPLQDYVISDDEVSNPDNCVYAYRGSVSESPEPHRPQVTQDDETDFLEMDFEPEPNSEADTSSLMELNVNLTPSSISSTIKHKQDDPPDKPNNIAVVPNLKSDIVPNVLLDLSENLVTVNKSPGLLNGSTTSSAENTLYNEQGQVKATGAIPKRSSYINKISSSSSISSLLTQSSQTTNNSMPLKNRNRDQNTSFNDAEEYDMSSNRTNDINFQKDYTSYNSRKIEKLKEIQKVPGAIIELKVIEDLGKNIYEFNQQDFLEKVNFCDK